MKHNGPPYLESIEWKVVQETGTRTGTLETGEVNFIEDVPTIDVQRLKGVADIVVLALPQAGSGESLMMNFKRSPTDQLAVRRAIQQGIDKQGMSDAVFDGVFPPACSIIQTSVFGYDPATCQMYPYNVDAAKKALADGGWVDANRDGIVEKDGQPLKLDLYYRSLPLNQAMSQYVQNQLRKVGIDVNLIGLERAGYFDAVRAGKHHLQFWWETFTDPDGVRIMLHSVNANGGTNRNNYVNPEMDKLIDDAAATSDPEKRKALYAQIQKKVLDEAIMVNLCDDQSLYAYRKGIQDFAMDIGGNYPYFYDTYITKA
jgi:peptide/nickel transport system substrate-binding protein